MTFFRHPADVTVHSRHIGMSENLETLNKKEICSPPKMWKLSFFRNKIVNMESKLLPVENFSAVLH